MSDTNLNQDNSTSIKNHEDILIKLEGIKQFEQRYPAFQLEELEVTEDLIEIEQKPDEFIPYNELINSVSPTVFRLRLSEEGILENIDLKKPKPKKDIKSIFKKIKIKTRLDKQNSKEIDNKSKKTGLKGILNKIGKLKRVIPSKIRKK